MMENVDLRIQNHWEARPDEGLRSSGLLFSLREDDLCSLGVALADRRKLEMMGFTTLQQIIALGWCSLSMGKDKRNSLVQRAYLGHNSN